MKKYFERLINDYNKILIEEGFEGKVKKRLLNKLEGILSGKILQDNSHSYLDNKISWKNLDLRTYNCLKQRCEIETYRDLIKYCYENWKDRPNSLKKPYLDSTLLKVQYFGEKSLKGLKKHLKSINFDFSEEFAKNIVDEK